MIGLKEVVVIHDVMIERFGGLKGVRDASVLASALHRPYHTFDGVDLYPDPIDKAAALFESIISNHPFIDGNKRTAYVLMRVTLLQYDLDLIATEDIKYDFVIKAAQGQLTFHEITFWIRSHLKKY